MNKKISYEDYLLMSDNETDKERMPNLIIRSMSVTFLEYYRYMLDDEFKEIESHVMQGVGLKNWNKHSDDDIVESTVVQTEMERIKKKKHKNYYQENATCAVETLKYIFSEDLYMDMTMAPNFVTHNYCHILKYILIDIDQLINEYEANINNNTKYHSNPHRHIHSMSLHNVLRQSAYGRASFHSFADVEIDASIAVIRQMIEMRIRRGFGIIAFLDMQGNIKPLDMSSLFEILKKYENSIEFPAKLSCIERIYKWGNLYIHSGRGDYAWLPYFLERYLRKLSFGEQKADGSWCYQNGIKVSEITLKKIREEVKKLNINYDILTCEPECEIIEESYSSKIN